MTVIYANNALIAIVAEAGRGLTKREILEINDRTYKAEIEKYWSFIESNNGLFIYKRNNKYYLRPSFNYNSEWRRKHIFRLLRGKKKSLVDKI